MGLHFVFKFQVAKNVKRCEGIAHGNKRIFIEIKLTSILALNIYIYTYESNLRTKSI